jgi:hypothetical protein
MDRTAYAMRALIGTRHEEVMYSREHAAHGGVQYSARPESGHYLR